MIFSIKKLTDSSYTNITNYIAHKGIKWQRADVDGANATRTLDGTLVRDRVAIMVRYDVTCRPLTASEANTLLNLIKDEYIMLRVSDPMFGTKEFKVYSNNIPATFLMKKGALEYWSGITFPLIQVEPLSEV